jgi:hypothetical protein
MGQFRVVSVFGARVGSTILGVFVAGSGLSGRNEQLPYAIGIVYASGLGI